MLSTYTLAAFTSELEKISAGPKVIEDASLLPRGMVGLHVRRKVIDANLHNPTVAAEIAQFGFKPGQDALFIPPAEQLRQAYGPNADLAGRIARRHEMTHWLRSQRGKMEGFGEPGLRNVLRTAREELAANLSSARTRGLSMGQTGNILLATPKSTLNSVRLAYPSGIWNAVRKVV